MPELLLAKNTKINVKVNISLIIKNFLPTFCRYSQNFSGNTLTLFDNFFKVKYQKNKIQNRYQIKLFTEHT